MLQLKKSYALVVLSLILMSTTCKKDPDCGKDSHPSLTIQNNSDQRIRYEFYWNYPDTAIGEYNPVNNGTDGLSPGESFTRGAGPNSCWESHFQNREKEWIHIFNADTIEALSWEVVRQTNRGLLDRREIDLNYLKQNNFEVIYE